jgi:hypothetical protein
MSSPLERLFSSCVQICVVLTFVVNYLRLVDFLTRGTKASCAYALGRSEIATAPAFWVWSLPALEAQWSNRRMTFQAATTLSGRGFEKRFLYIAVHGLAEL